MSCLAFRTSRKGLMSQQDQLFISTIYIVSSWVLVKYPQTLPIYQLHPFKKVLNYFQRFGPLGRLFFQVEMFLCLFVCLSVRPTLVNCLFAPTSWSPMSKLFRFSESFGKKQWKEVVSDYKNICL